MQNFWGRRQQFSYWTPYTPLPCYLWEAYKISHLQNEHFESYLYSNISEFQFTSWHRYLQSPEWPVSLSFSRSLWNPRGHCERPGDRGELRIPWYGCVSVSARLSANRLIGSDLSPRQPVVWTAACLYMWVKCYRSYRILHIVNTHIQTAWVFTHSVYKLQKQDDSDFVSQHNQLISLIISADLLFQGEKRQD